MTGDGPCQKPTAPADIHPCGYVEQHVLSAENTDKNTDSTCSNQHLGDEATHEPYSKSLGHVGVESGRQLTLIKYRRVDELVVLFDAVVVGLPVGACKSDIVLVCIAIVVSAIVELVWVP